jgi:putative methyltransferase (TIGR04325 family)
MGDGAPGAEHVWFSGNFASWAEARRVSTGYDAPSILEKVRAATLKVMAGEAACERDSVTFQRVEYSLPLLVCLLYVASRCQNRLHVLDFGGSLGSSYWQSRRFLGHLTHLQWSVVEQPHFVEVGQRDVQNDVLRFHHSVNQCFQERVVPNLVLLSGVLQAVEAPQALFGDLLSRRVPFVVLDRTQFFTEDLPDRITVERVHPDVYEASYPSWFFNLGRFRKLIDSHQYRILEEFDSWECWSVNGDRAQNKCFLLERQDSTT